MFCAKHRKSAYTLIFYPIICTYVWLKYIFAIGIPDVETNDFVGLVVKLYALCEAQNIYVRSNNLLPIACLGLLLMCHETFEISLRGTGNILRAYVFCAEHRIYTYVVKY